MPKSALSLIAPIAPRLAAAPPAARLQAVAAGATSNAGRFSTLLDHSLHPAAEAAAPQPAGIATAAGGTGTAGPQPNGAMPGAPKPAVDLTQLRMPVQAASAVATATAPAIDNAIAGRSAPVQAAPPVAPAAALPLPVAAAAAALAAGTAQAHVKPAPKRPTPAQQAQTAAIGDLLVADLALSAAIASTVLAAAAAIPVPKPDAAPVTGATPAGQGAAPAVHTYGTAVQAADPTPSALPAPLVQAVAAAAPVQAAITAHLPADTHAASGSATVPVAVQVGTALVALTGGQGSQRVTVQLSPTELGRVQISIERSADGTSVISVTAERPETLALVRADAAQLHAALDQAGVGSHGRALQFFAAAANGADTAPDTTAIDVTAAAKAPDISPAPTVAATDTPAPQGQAGGGNAMSDSAGQQPNDSQGQGQGQGMPGRATRAMVEAGAFITDDTPGVIRIARSAAIDITA